MKKNRGGKSRGSVLLTTKYSKSFQVSFVIGLIFVFSFKGIRNSVYMNLYGIPRYWTVKNFAELREIKSIPYKIPYSAEFQKGTSENTLVRIRPLSELLKSQRPESESDRNPNRTDVQIPFLWMLLKSEFLSFLYCGLG
jgi:hypothetical protein